MNRRYLLNLLLAWAFFLQEGVSSIHHLVGCDVSSSGVIRSDFNEKAIPHKDAGGCCYRCSLCSLEIFALSFVAKIYWPDFNFLSEIIIDKQIPPVNLATLLRPPILA